MTRPYSMDLRDRVVARVLAGESVRSVALALRCDRIDAPFVFDQPINGAIFTQWVEEQL